MTQYGLWKSADYLSVRELWEDYTATYTCIA
jgi:hypothetical protein